jgi:hypothetical protein
MESIGNILQKQSDEGECPLGLCDGTGVVAVDEEDGEGHTMRGVGSRPCPCRNREDEDMDDDS